MFRPAADLPESDPSLAPRVSVIAIAYRQPAFLNQALASVARQSFGHWELIVVDDGSGDEVVAQYELPPGTRLLRHERCRGAAAISRNSGLELARGEYLAFLDQDDAWLPAHLATAVAALDAHPDAGLVFTGHIATDETLVPRARQASFAPLPADPLRGMLKKNLITTPSSVLVRRSALDAAGGGFDEGIIGSADRDLWLRLAACSRLIALPEALCLYRMHAAQLHRHETATRPGRIAFHEKTLRWAERERPELVPRVRRAFARMLCKIARIELARGDDGLEAARAAVTRAREVDPWNLRPRILQLETRVRRLRPALS